MVAQEVDQQLELGGGEAIEAGACRTIMVFWARRKSGSASSFAIGQSNEVCPSISRSMMRTASMEITGIVSSAPVERRWVLKVGLTFLMRMAN